MDSITYDIVIICDNSGSMQTMGNEPLEALNSFITEQKNTLDDDSTFTLWQFNHELSLKIDDVPLKEVGDITDYTPSGMTALFDAIGHAIQTKLQKSKKDYVICLIITDGVENSSTEFTSRAQIQQLIKTAEEEHHWKFVYIGANQDAFSVGENMGLYRNCCAQFEPVNGGLHLATREVSQNIAVHRTASSQNGYQEENNVVLGIPQPPYIVRQSPNISDPITSPPPLMRQSPNIRSTPPALTPMRQPTFNRQASNA